MKLDKTSYIIYVDLEILIKKIEGCINNPAKSSATKVCEHIPSGYSLETIQAFNNIENNYTIYCGEDRMKRFCDSLREYAKNVAGFVKNKMLPLTKGELKSHVDAKVWLLHMWKKDLIKSH